MIMWFDMLRQHVVALHFSQGAAERVNRLALDEESLKKRDKWIESHKEANQPAAEDIQDLSDEFGTGCFLSCNCKTSSEISTVLMKIYDTI